MEKEKLEDKMSYKVFRDVAMMAVGIILTKFGFYYALITFIVIIVGVATLKKIGVKKDVDY